MKQEHDNYGNGSGGRTITGKTKRFQSFMVNLRIGSSICTAFECIGPYANEWMRNEFSGYAVAVAAVAHME